MARNTDTGSRLGGPANAGRPDRGVEVGWESEKRKLLGVPGLVAGVLYLLSGIVINSALSGAPTVGVLQAMAPALKGVANPSESPRAAEVRFISRHAFPLIAGSALSSLALLTLAAMLYLLARATRFRNPSSWAAAGPLAVIGGVGFAVIGVAHEVASAVLAHNFAAGTNFTNAAVERALTTGSVNVASEYISLIVGLALVVGMIALCLQSMRVGLLTRWMGVIGILAALLLFLPIGGATLEVIPAFWIAALGLLYTGRWPNGEPPAWAAGEARPWPSQAEMRAQQQAEAAARRNGRRSGSTRSQPQATPAGTVSGNATGNGRGGGDGGAPDVLDAREGVGDDGAAMAPAPAPAGVRGTEARKRRRKHGSRR